MSKQYDAYINQHKLNVYKGFQWMCENIPEIFANEEIRSACEHQCCYAHDQSKYSIEEYNAYDDYFYGGNRSFAVVQAFNLAWLHHIHANPHHWQYWILINDEPGEGKIILDMPDNYIIEMICDWWAFSWSKDNLHEIFSWYDEHKNYMQLSEKTRKKVENILEKIRGKLKKADSDDE